MSQNKSIRKYALRASALVDVKNKSLMSNPIVIIKGDTIHSVGRESEIEVPNDAEFIDLKGHTLMPGLVDAHMHLTGLRTGNLIVEPLITPLGVFFARAVKDLESLINSGFTTIKDSGSLIALHLKYAVAEGSIKGPRIVAAGYPLSQTFGHADIHYMPLEYVDVRTTRKLTPMARLICDGPDSCRAAARYALREGADYIKIMATGGVLSQKDRPEFRQFTYEEIKAIVDEARAAKTFVEAHAQSPEGIKNAVRAGVRVIAHAIYIDDECVELMRERNTIVVPTLSVVEMILRHGSEAGIPEWGLKKTEEVHEVHVNSVRRLWRAGINIAVGTDFIGGPYFKHGNNALELKLLVEKIGMRPIDAIASATLIASKAAGLMNVGLIERGYKADIIAVKGNPLNNIDVLLNPNNISFVMKEGEVLKMMKE